MGFGAGSVGAVLISLQEAELFEESSRGRSSGKGGLGILRKSGFVAAEGLTPLFHK